MKNKTVKDAWTIDLNLGTPDENEPVELPSCETLKCSCGNSASVYFMGEGETVCLCQECAYPNQPECEFQSTFPIRWLGVKED